MISKKLNLISYIVLAIFAFVFNFWASNNGVFPIDTFLHYDSAYRILSGSKPIKDFWIIHGITVDYIQSIFFYLFGVNWSSYISHSSLFNSILVVIFFKLLIQLNIRFLYSILLSLSFLILAYPISGVPFVDHHATFFSLICFLIFYFGLINNNYKYFIIIPILFGLAFLSKPVPSTYLSLAFAGIFIFYLISEKKIEPFLYVIYGTILFLLLFYLFLKIEKIPLQNFLEQMVLYPLSIGADRTVSIYEAFKLRALNYKFIYFLLFYLILILLFKKNYNKFSKPNLYLFISIILFTLTMVIHQVMTKNQNFIFFLIPLNICLIFYINDKIKIKNKKKINLFFLIVCIFLTIKYYDRFIDKRKFHDLQNVNLDNAISAKKIHETLQPLKWITINYNDPHEEVKIIKELINIIESSEQNILLISNYNFFDSITEKKVFGFAKTLDNVTFPQEKNKYRQNFKKFFLGQIKNNNIGEIYLFFPEIEKIDKYKFGFKELLDPLCFDSFNINSMTAKLKIKKC